MGPLNRILSSVLLAAGIVFVFTGLSAALGSSLPGMVASVSAIAALLYAGSVWFGPPPAIPLIAGAPTVMVFDRDLRVTAGPGAGSALLSKFPAAIRPEIEIRCRAALAGESTRFVCHTPAVRLVIETAPLASITGVVLYGTLVASSGLAAPTTMPRPLSTVA
jgi:hypothetical protein